MTQVQLVLLLANFYFAKSTKSNKQSQVYSKLKYQ